MALKAKRPSGRTKDHVSDMNDQLDAEARLTLLIPASVKKKLKMYAIEHETNVSAVVREAIDGIINK